MLKHRKHHKIPILICENFWGFIRLCKPYKLANNGSKLTEIDERIKKDSKKLKEVENDSTYSEEQREPYRDMLEYLKLENKQGSK